MARVTVAAGSQLAADAGAAIADAGGNAIDAAVASVLTTLCTDPGIVAPGACGFVAVHPAGGEALLIDGYAEMPGRSAPAGAFGSGRPVRLAYGGGVDTVVGYGSAAVPGIYAALEEAWRRHGRLPWATLFEPAIAAVEAGFPLSEPAAEYLHHAHEAVFGWQAESWTVLHNADGTPLQAGAMVTVPHLADTLRLLADHGADALYRGDLGAAIADAVAADGGLLGRDDLAAYRAERRRPVRFRLGSWEVDTNPAPAVGGSTMAAVAMLALSAGWSGWSAADVLTLVRSQRAVLDYRRRRLSAPDEITPNIAELLDAARLGDLGRVVSSSSTSHCSTADTDGNVCAVTVSAGYGSGAMPPGTGFWLNNSLGELELHPSGYHGLAPGTRLVSNMAPTTARRPGTALAIGSAGADRITTTLSAILLNFLVLDLPLQAALHHPRLHVEVFEGTEVIAHEPGTPVQPVDGLGLRPFAPMSMYFGGAQAALTAGADGLLGVADPRRNGGVATGG
ncbi:MAG: gamma-glutamyltransferase [Acidimicrobiia bacterium]|nr:gamma-glutamyltransferase [Acidimicrobiia bacterium]